jgi:hypothetical protein
LSGPSAGRGGGDHSDFSSVHLRHADDHEPVCVDAASVPGRFEHRRAARGHAHDTGPMTLTQAGTIIEAKSIRGRLTIAANNVVIKRSKLVGIIDSDRAGVHVTILDSEIDGGTSKAPAVGYGDITMCRVNVYGSRVSVLCGSNCLIEDSWLHGQYLAPGSDWHVNGYLSNGGSNVVVRHNTITCEPQDNSNDGGCTGPGASIGDFAPLRNITYDGNLFVAGPGGFCLRAGHDPGKLYGNDPTGIVITNNVFQRGANGKCCVWGAVTSFNASGAGNVFSNNKWDDGTTVYP